MGDDEAVCWCGHPHTNGPACPKYGCSCVLHAPFDEAMTDLPDAVVELTDAEIDDLGQELDNPNKVYRLDRMVAAVESIVAARLAAASGPWAEQLDAANPDEWDCWCQGQFPSDKDYRHKEGCPHGTIGQSCPGFCPRCSQPCAHADLAAALARNAELEEQRDAEQEMHAQDCAENSRLRAELDNLRDRVNALADEWEAEADRYESYIEGSSIRNELVSIVKTLRDNATALRTALVRGSDDKAGEDA